MRWIGSLALTSALAVAGARGEEVQSHGYRFEQRVWNHLFDRGYTDEWDIPGPANLVNPGIPISVKCIEWGNSIYLGDALRQREIDVPFEMIVGFYEKSGEGEEQKQRLVALHRVRIAPQDWNRWWGQVTRDDLARLAGRIKEGDIAQAQAYAREEAARLRELSPVFSINPKINSDQRRIQCSIPFQVFHREVLKQEPEKQSRLTLWGRPFPAH